jgi:hypothetical protein
MPDPLERLERHLTAAQDELNKARKLIKRTTLDYSTNFEYVAHAMADALRVQLQVYEQRPDLTPEHLKPDWATNVPPDATWTREFDDDDNS